MALSVFKIKKEVLQTMLKASKNIYPDEFIAIMQGEVNEKEAIITSVIIPPFSTYERDASSFSDWFLPPMFNVIGIFHSHPNGNGEPSIEDLNSFAIKGKLHIIAFPPFTLKSVKCFDNKGKEVNIAIIT